MGHNHYDGFNQIKEAPLFIKLDKRDLIYKLLAIGSTALVVGFKPADNSNSRSWFIILMTDGTMWLSWYSWSIDELERAYDIISNIDHCV
jgi:hypothetical protein